MKHYLTRIIATMLCGGLTAAACDDNAVPPTSPSPPTAPSPPAMTAIANDADLYNLVTQREPFASYTPFPRAEGILAAAGPHRPQVRVSINARFAGALQNGRLPAGARFPDGSVLFKEILTDGRVSLYAVMYKAASDSRAGNGWLWAEFAPNGSVAVSMNSRGSGCTSCHQDAQGTQNDSVRMFERQR